MIKYSSESAQKKRRGFLDPRTKIALTVLLAVFVLGGLGGPAMEPVKTIPSGVPFLLLLIEKQWSRFFRGALILVTGYGLLLLMPFMPGTNMQTAFVGLILPSGTVSSCCLQDLPAAGRRRS